MSEAETFFVIIGFIGIIISLISFYFMIKKRIKSRLKDKIRSAFRALLVLKFGRNAPDDAFFKLIETLLEPYTKYTIKRYISTFWLKKPIFDNDLKKTMGIGRNEPKP